MTTALLPPNKAEEPARDPRGKRGCCFSQLNYAFFRKDDKDDDHRGNARHCYEPCGKITGAAFAVGGQQLHEAADALDAPPDRLHALLAEHHTAPHNEGSGSRTHMT